MHLSGGPAEVVGLVVGEAYSVAVAVVMWEGRRAFQALWSGPCHGPDPDAKRGGACPQGGISTAWSRAMATRVPERSDDRHGTGAQRGGGGAGGSSAVGTGDEIGDGDHLIAVGARSSGPPAAAEGATALAALGAEVALIAAGALVDDGVLGEPPSEQQEAFVLGLAAEPEAALPAGVRAPDAAAVGDEVASTAGTGAFGRRCVTQRGSPPAGDAAWSRP